MTEEELFKMPDVDGFLPQIGSTTTSKYSNRVKYVKKNSQKSKENYSSNKSVRQKLKPRSISWPKLKTGDDVIAYFAAQNSNDNKSAKYSINKPFSPRVRTVYLRREIDLLRLEKKRQQRKQYNVDGTYSMVEDYDPYALIVVSENSLRGDLDYFIMSETSVMKLKNTFGKKSSLLQSIVPLTEWVEEHSIFRTIRKIKYFKYYRVAKSFHLWKAFLRKVRLAKARRVLSRNLFFANEKYFPILYPLLALADRLLCQPGIVTSYGQRILLNRKHKSGVKNREGKEGASNESLGAGANSMTTNMEAFKDIQVEYAEKNLRVLVTQFGIDAYDKLNKLVGQYLDRLKEANNFIDLFESGLTGEKKASLVDKKLKLAEKREEKSIYDLFFSKLSNFCRLINYILIETHLTFLTCAVEELSKYIALSRNAHTGVFKVQALISTSQTELEISFEPDSARTIKMFQTMATKLLNVFGGCPLIPLPRAETFTKTGKITVLSVIYGIIRFENEKQKEALLLVKNNAKTFSSKMWTSSAMVENVLPRILKATSSDSLSDSATLVAICARDFNFEKLFSVINDTIISTFEECHKHKKQLIRSFATIFSYCVQFKAEDCLLPRKKTDNDTDSTSEQDEEEQVPPQSALEMVREKFVQFDSWLKQVCTIKLEVKCGEMITLDCKGLRTHLVDKLESCRADLTQLILSIARDRCVAIQEEFSRGLELLQFEEDQDLEAHTLLVEQLGRYKILQRQMFMDYNYVQELYKYISEREIKVPLEEASTLDLLIENREKFETQLILAETHKTNMKAKSILDLTEKENILQTQSEDLFATIKAAKFEDPNSNPEDICQEMTLITEKYKDQLRLKKEYHKMNILLHRNSSDNDSKLENDEDFFSGFQLEGTLSELAEAVDRLNSIWYLSKQWKSEVKHWCQSDLRIVFNDKLNNDELTGPKVERKVDEYFQTALGLGQKFGKDTLSEELLLRIRKFRANVSYLVQFGHPSLKTRHYKLVYEILNLPFLEAPLLNNGGKAITEFDDEEEESTIPTLEELQNNGLLNDENVDRLEEICAGALKEYSILTSLNKMETEWEDIYFDVLDYKDTGHKILKAMDDVEQILDDHIVKTTAIKTSRYVIQFEERCTKFLSSLKDLVQIISNRLELQGTWLYLEPIFSSPDICKQMPVEAKIFMKINGFFKNIMDFTSNDPKVMNVFNFSENVLDDLVTANEQLEIVNKGLADYLNEKRVFFPRFFFLSNDELLEILSETKDPLKVQPHLIKCFEGISKLEFTNTLDILAMISVEGEKVPFEYEAVDEKMINPMEAGGCVEIWLDQIQTLMRKTVAYVFDLSMNAYPLKPRTDWLVDWPGQVVLGVSQTYWTKEVTDSMESGDESMRRCVHNLSKNIDNIILMVRQKIPGLVRKTVSPLVVLDVHARDVTQDLVERGILSKNDFDWLAQLRYYWKPNEVTCSMINATIPYMYEYLGNSMRLGYAGRQELPDNLKALFRSVAMMVPNYSLIGQIILYSMGYLEGFTLAKKIVMTYKLCSEQLSSQSHYDYGMRAVVAVLRAAGNLKREQPDEDERILCLRSIIDVNLPKFLAPDVPLFNGIVSDLFPGVKLPETDYFKMKAEILRICNLAKFIATEYILTKIYEVYEMMCVRHGFMVVGLPFSGKSVALRILQLVLKNLYHAEPDNEKWARVFTCSINPKSITMGQLYGEFDPVSHEWTDGVLAIRYRDFSVDRPEGEIKGDEIQDLAMNNLWIENMNTVLDDNKKLCLMSGEMIKMSDTMSMIFEPMDLEVASPATVSRVGIIYMEPSRMGWKPLLEAWLLEHMEPTQEDKEDKQTYYEDEAAKCKENKFLFTSAHAKLISLFYHYVVDPVLCFLRKVCRESVSTLDQCLVVSSLRYIKSITLDFINLTRRKKLNSLVINDIMLLNILLFSVLWAIGGTISSNQRSEVSLFIHKFLVNHKVTEEEEELKPVNTLLLLRNWSYREEFQKIEKLIPKFLKQEDTDFFNYVLDLNIFLKPNSTQFDQTYGWIKWEKLIPKTAIRPRSLFSNIVVNTLETTQIETLLGYQVNYAFPFLLVGDSGTGKSLLLNNVVFTHTLNQDIYKVVSTQFTAKSGANSTQKLLDSKVDKRKKGIFGPSLGCKILFFIDDFNMPEVEEYGAQPSIEIVRQLVDSGGWYDLETKEFRKIIETQLLTSMCPAGGPRSTITPRMLRHFSILYICEFDNNTLSQIFSTILNWHFGIQSFAFAAEKNINEELTGPIVQSLIFIYQKCKAELLPTPLKSHYTFNLRDFGRVVQGILLSTEHPNFGSDGLKKLFIHETCRVFKDRLVNKEDQVWLVSCIGSAINHSLNTKFDSLSSEVSEELGDLRFCDKLMFGDYTERAAQTRIYKEIPPDVNLISKFEDYLEAYNSEQKTGMDLVMFNFAIQHISRLIRVFRLEGGNILLVGVGGSGRQSLAKLATYVCQYKLFQVELTKSYGVAEWREDLSMILKEAGVGNTEVVFLFSDTQIKYNSFVEDINSILSSGEVPDLFPFDVKMNILEGVQKIAKQHDLGHLKDASQAVLWSFFLSRVRSRLHLALAFSPIGSSFRERLRKFPSLVNCCTIDWFFNWPENALKAVATKLLGNLSGLDEKILQQIVIVCQTMHESTRVLGERMFEELKRVNYVTPTSYLELIKCYQSSLSKCRDAVLTQKQRYETGLEKLGFAASQVGNMQMELTDMIPTLEKSKEETNDLMQVIERKLPGVQEMKKSVNAEKLIVEAQAAGTSSLFMLYLECNKMKEECEEDLKEAIPLLQEAINALDTLKPSDITEVKAMKTPPKLVVLVMSAICEMMGIKPDRVKDPNDAKKKMDDFWAPSKKYLLGDPKFLQNLKDFDKDNIPAKVITILQTKYLSNPDFEAKKIKQASVAAHGLFKWIVAMEKYNGVAKIVEPKKAKLKETEQELKDTMDILNSKTVIRILFYLLGSTTKEKLEADVDLCEKKLTRAKQLIEGLGGEKSRWTDNVSTLEQDYVSLTGNVLVSSGILAYLGAFTADYRENIVREQWIPLVKGSQGQNIIPCTENISLANTLGDQVQIRNWMATGLPSDNFSIENGIILFNSNR
eukprot:augustus_masked-scaffold_6-processed-gene-16.9-mRNA-1 protein AED:0.16 eAED:0.16 QI:0/0/0/1/1/1/4/0/3086